MDKETNTDKPQTLHDKLWAVCKVYPEDYEPYGKKDREEGDLWLLDCSCGCKHYAPLEGKAGFDWGVCHNPLSHRRGLLTFEHQGCPKFEPLPEDQKDQDLEDLGYLETLKDPKDIEG